MWRAQVRGFAGEMKEFVDRAGGQCAMVRD